MTMRDAAGGKAPQGAARRPGETRRHLARSSGPGIVARPSVSPSSSCSWLWHWSESGGLVLWAAARR